MLASGQLFRVKDLPASGCQSSKNNNIDNVQGRGSEAGNDRFLILFGLLFCQAAQSTQLIFSIYRHTGCELAGILSADS